MERWDGISSPQWAPNDTVTLYGGGQTESFVLPVTWGLNGILDPCSNSGHPLSVSDRWMVLKVKSRYATPVLEDPPGDPVLRYTLHSGGLRLATRVPLNVVDPSGRVRMHVPSGW